MVMFGLLFSWNDGFVTILCPVHVVSSPMPKFYSIENQFIKMNKNRFSCSEADRKCSKTDTTNSGLLKHSALNDGFDKNHFVPSLSIMAIHS